MVRILAMFVLMARILPGLVGAPPIAAVPLSCMSSSLELAQLRGAVLGAHALDLRRPEQSHYWLTLLDVGLRSLQAGSSAGSVLGDGGDGSSFFTINACELGERLHRLSMGSDIDLIGQPGVRVHDLDL